MGEAPRDLKRRAAEAIVDGDLARAALFLEKVSDNSPWSTRTLSWIYQQLATDGPDPRTRLRLDFTPNALQHAREVTNRAWRVFETADDLDALRRALAELRRALTSWPHLAAARETEVRILLRLGRDPEAFAVTMWLDQWDPGRSELADVRASAAYGAWCSETPERTRRAA